MSLTVDDGTLITKDPADVAVYVFDWNVLGALAVGASIATSTWTITAIRPSADTALTKDNPSILAGNRTTQIRVSAGTNGALYELTNTIVTNETPSQTKERSERILVQNR